MSKFVKIDRSIPFNPVSFIGRGWSVVEQDNASLMLSEIDLDKVKLETMLKDGEGCVTGEDKLKRLKDEKFIRLDAKVLQTLWENKNLIPESWSQITDSVHYVFFDGTVLKDLDGDRFVPCLVWQNGEWDRSYGQLYFYWMEDSPSAVLKS